MRHPKGVITHVQPHDYRTSSTTRIQGPQQLHNSTVGHVGLKRLLERLKETNETIPTKQVESFLKGCPVCQKNNDRSYNVNVNRTPLSTSRPMQRLNIDTIGPFEVDADNNRHIVVIIDTFTRYVVLYPAKTLEAKECAQIFFKHLCRQDIYISRISRSHTI